MAALREVGDLGDWSGKLFPHAVDFNAPLSGLDSVSWIKFLPKETTLFHFAGDTRFTPQNPAAQREVNVQGPLNVVGAWQGKISRFVHISTAYVAGNRTGLVREDELDCGQTFWNSYEKSKFDAEMMLNAFCRKQKIPFVIIRPSIIVNDRISGRASTFTHLNALVEVVSRSQAYYGISDGQVVNKTIRVMADPEARPNLAAVDSIVPPLVKIAESPAAAGKTFHLCHPRPQSNAEIMDLLCETFKVKGKLTLEFLEHIPKPMSHTEEMVFRSLKVYAPYLNNSCEFDLSNSRSVVPEYDSYFSPLDTGYLQKVAKFQRQSRE